jgi:VIT1/CCC1 family predicted Fe2+/Mn2+ transporter
MELHAGRINKNYIHHQKSSFANVLREIIFGMEDGMVSTLGSITGIAIGSQDHSIVILAGIVIISVESISMGIGSYVSNISHEEMNRRKITEEKEELRDFPEEEKEELREMYLEDGWSETMATQMSLEASKNPELILKEMTMHELKITCEESSSVKGGIAMFFAYVAGGLVPLAAYFIFPIKTSLPLSIAVTLAGLFFLGMGTTKFTKEPVIKSSLRMLLMGGVALLVGLLAGTFIGQ